MVDDEARLVCFYALSLYPVLNELVKELLVIQSLDQLFVIHVLLKHLLKFWSQKLQIPKIKRIEAKLIHNLERGEFSRKINLEHLLYFSLVNTLELCL